MDRVCIVPVVPRQKSSFLLLLIWDFYDASLFIQQSFKNYQLILSHFKAGVVGNLKAYIVSQLDQLSQRAAVKWHGIPGLLVCNFQKQTLTGLVAHYKLLYNPSLAMSFQFVGSFTGQLNPSMF